MIQYLKHPRVQWFLAGFGIALVLLVSSFVFGAERYLNPHDSNYAANASRACEFPSGGWTTIDCSNVLAVENATALNPSSRYVIQCDDASYIAWGASTDIAADANDGWIAEGAWLEFGTDRMNLYVSVLNKNEDSNCQYIECK